ncbi:MAG: hypothetical protein AAF889_12270 [Cyanobacteria bacterium P01_D01_bin.73]
MQTTKRDNLPIYVRAWNGLKQFPKGLANGSANPPNSSGPAAAALVSASFSCLALMINQHFCNIFERWDQIIWKLGSWIPGTYNDDPIQGQIGSYSGKETVMLLAWIATWIGLSLLWKNRNVPFKVIFFCLFTFITAATVMSWHPLFPYMPLMGN